MVRQGSIHLLVVALILVSGRASADTSSAAPDTVTPDTAAVDTTAVDTAAVDTTAVDTTATLPLELGEEFFAKLDDENCTDLKDIAYREIPKYILADRPDLLHEFVLYWESRCLTTEPVFRILLLGSIWDAGFDEDLYGEVVIEHLIDRYDPPTKPNNPDLRKSFDDFSASFADQLLPHVPYRSLEEFFCLFYAGKTAEAWALLESEDLEDTWMRYYYDEEITYLSRNDPIPTLAATGGGWWPRGNVEFAGDKPLVGLLTGVRWSHWLARFAFEVRVGRTDRPYWVDENGFFGRSDRFDAVFIGAEGGRILFGQGRHNLDLFGGIGLDAVKPFKDEDHMISSLNVNLGIGYRFFLGKNQNWMMGVDVRHEWIGERNEKTDSMSGRALSLRFSVGFAFEKGKTRRLAGLGR
jgi:hypothetical protein